MIRWIVIGIVLVIAYWFLDDWLSTTAAGFRQFFCWMFPQC